MIFLSCNFPPLLSSIDGGISRRIRVLELKNIFCDEDKYNKEKNQSPYIKKNVYVYDF
jgi:hypothetical protein